MSEFVRCAGCGVVRDDDGACSECGTEHTFGKGRSRLALVGFLGSAGLALTLAACYGGPPRPIPKGAEPTPSASGSTSGATSASNPTP